MNTNAQTNTAHLLPLSAPVGVSGVTLPAGKSKAHEHHFRQHKTWSTHATCEVCGWAVNKEEILKNPTVLDRQLSAELLKERNATSPAEPVTPPASHVDSVGVPALALNGINIIRGNDTIGQLTDETDIPLGAEMVMAFNSHAANLAKIKAIEAAGKALLEFLEQYPHQHATDISGYESDLSDALALPSA